MIETIATFWKTYYAPVQWPEWVAVVTAIIYIVLSVREKPLCWPFGIVSAGFWMWSSIYYGFYMDGVLQAYYVIIGFYGWYEWLHGSKQKSELPVSRTNAREWAILSSIGIVSTAAFGLFYAGPYTDFCDKRGWDPTSYPWWDTVTTVMSFIATWMLARKKLENWILWIIADGIYIWLYDAKGMRGVSAMMVIYTIMAVVGFVRWRRSYLDAQNRDSDNTPLANTTENG